MSHAALTAKYRPQTFAQVAGQETIKAILSRASLEQRVAPAYLFSGTRGVGKTTLARIFAKALNCRSAPAGEPCNVCDQCRAITTGSAVDVVEIDGASNRGIDDVRRLKEVVGYAPMEGGYKIFIIDEAHMLSREAFNALLKTLEEPPARVTFIMATTEPHKFPATIISRCQHFVFKPLPESGLLAHLSQVLATEGIAHDESALRLIARRGAGSVRDSMSLLGQVLALGEDTLTEASVRSVLGLAGQEAFTSLLEAVKNGDSVALSALLRDMLEQGLDMGFFLREMASLWRNLFMLRQSGERALAVVDLQENEARRYLEISCGFSLQHIHACWQMTLEGQRRVLTSLEPALALELLLLNIGMLPQLLSLENLSSMSRKAPAPTPGAASGPLSGGTPPSAPSGGRADPGAPARGMSPSEQLISSSLADQPEVLSESRPSGREENSAVTPHPLGEGAIPRPSECETGPDLAVLNGMAQDLPDAPPLAEEEYDEAAIQSALAESEVLVCAPAPAVSAVPAPALSALTEDVSGPRQNSATPEAAPTGVFVAASEPDWEHIFALAEARETPPWFLSLLRHLEARWDKGELFLEAQDGFTLDRLNDAQILHRLEELLSDWCGAPPRYTIAARQVARKSREDLKAEVMEHPLVKEVQERFGGYVIDYGQLR